MPGSRTPMTRPAECVKDSSLLKWCKASDDNLNRVLDVVIDENNMMGGYTDQMEDIFTDIYGQRVECPNCEEMIFPAHLCYECADWTAPCPCPDCQRSEENQEDGDDN